MGTKGSSHGHRFDKPRREAAEEQLIVVRGAVMAEMTDHPRTRLGPGGFAVMGTHMAHQFACQGTAACVMFVTFDRAYDIRWLKR